MSGAWLEVDLSDSTRSHNRYGPAENRLRHGDLLLAVEIVAVTRVSLVLGNLNLYN